MNLRQIKRRTVRMMDHQSWEYVTTTPSEADPKMFHVRKVKPCRSYDAWCGNCNVVLFRRLMGRFPYKLAEFNAFEQAQQEKENA